MTAALYHLPHGALSGRVVGDVVALDGEEGHHAVTVKRAQVGEQLLLADGTGVLGRGEVVSLRAGGADVRLTRLEEAVVAGPRFVLVQALAKGGRDEQAVEAATELGVDGVLPWQARRCIVRWRPDRVERSVAKWRAVATAAAKQSRRATTPEVAGPLTTSDLARRMGGSDAPAAVLLLHEDAQEPLALTPLPEEGEVWLLVGPEGGIAPEELDALVAAGARPVRLGSTVLRSSSAGPAALAVLNSRGRWR